MSPLLPKETSCLVFKFNSIKMKMLLLMRASCFNEKKVERMKKKKRNPRRRNMQERMDG